MHLVQILLPLADNEGAAFPPELYATIRDELTERFGGVTAFMRAPAEGFWAPDNSGVARDEIAIFEVMAEDLDRSWWTDYRRSLEQRFRQDVIVVRAQAIEML